MLGWLLELPVRAVYEAGTIGTGWRAAAARPASICRSARRG
jgi:hypothetical protein